MSNTAPRQIDPPDDFVRVYRVVESFDAAWHAAVNGKAPPRMEALLRAISQAERDMYLRELLAVELECRGKRGESPAVAEYLRRFPAHAETIRAVFAECEPVLRVPPATDQNATQVYAAAPGATPPAIPAGPLIPGTTLGNYTILGLIGQGGMGAVYRAEHRRMKRMVALKMISPSALQNPEALGRFQREARAMARLEHPNIVTAHDADQAGDIHFLVLQYVDGDDLSTTVKTNGPLAIDLAIRCLMQTARGLEYAHQEGVVHRDIKPSNLVVAKNGVVKILDMGLARLERSLSDASLGCQNLTEPGEIMGTIDFMAPEQALDAKIADQRADIYSLGCTLYYLLTGQALYAGDTMMKRIMAHRFEPVRSLCAARADVPIWLEGIFQKMVAKQASDRYQSMTEVLTALGPYVPPGLLDLDSEVSVSGRRHLVDVDSPPRPAAALPVDVLGARKAVPDSATEKTIPIFGFAAQFKALIAQRPAVAAVKVTPPGHATRRKPANKRRRLFAVAAAYFGVLVALAAVIYFQTDGGTLVIEAAGQEVTAALHEQGIRVHNANSGRAFTLAPGRHNLKSGEYQVDDAQLPAGLEISTNQFRLKRSGSVTLLVTLARPADNLSEPAVGR